MCIRDRHKVEVVPFGDMDQGVDRQIKESSIIGGNTKNVYACLLYTSVPDEEVEEGEKLHRVEAVLGARFPGINKDGIYV